MTIVEFYTADPVENLVSSLALSPDRIVFIGDKRRMQRKETLYTRFLRDIGSAARLEYRSVNRHELSNIVEVLTALVMEDDCVFDLTGGEELVLTAMGIVYERYRSERRIAMHRFHLSNGTVRDVVNDERLALAKKPSLTIEQLVALRGGVCGGSTDGDALTEWDFTPVFSEAIDRMWAVCKQDPARWNAAVASLCEFLKWKRVGEPPCRVAVEASCASRIGRYEEKRCRVKALLKELDRAQVVALHETEPDLVFDYADAQVRRCLSKAGNLLELKVMLTAKSLKDHDGAPLFEDVRGGVYIDWDGRFGGDNDTKWDTVNEVDVLLMHGLTPVFVSCKNGTVDDAELYKLCVVAERFGGPRAVKVLVATYIEHNELVRAYLIQRAKSMGVYLIEDAHRLTDEELARKIRHTVC